MTSEAINLTRVTKIFGGANLSARSTTSISRSARGSSPPSLGRAAAAESTILNLMAGFGSRRSGEVRVDGAVVRNPGPDRAVVFQEAALFPWLSVWENTVFSAKARGQPKSAYERKARQFLARVGLSDFTTICRRSSPEA